MIRMLVVVHISNELSIEYHRYYLVCQAIRSLRLNILFTVTTRHIDLVVFVFNFLLCFTEKWLRFRSDNRQRYKIEERKKTKHSKKSSSESVLNKFISGQNLHHHQQQQQKLISVLSSGLVSNANSYINSYAAAQQCANH